MIQTSANNKSLKLLILRGAPGTGKTFLATKTKAFTDGTWKVVSADTFFYQPDGKYVFHSKQLPDAHAQCFTDAYNYLSQGFNVIVDNTNRKHSEFSKYLKLASNEHLPKIAIRIFSMHFYYGSTKLLPHHVVDRYIREYEPFCGEQYVSLNLSNFCIDFHPLVDGHYQICVPCKPEERAKLKAF
jgi:predicted kinase